MGRTSSKLSKATMMLLVIRLTMMGSEVANKFLKATGWVDLPFGFRFLPTSLQLMKKEYHKHNRDSKRWHQKVGNLLQKDESQTAKTTSTVNSGRMRCMRWGAVICLPRANAIQDICSLITLVIIALKMGGRPLEQHERDTCPLQRKG
jgi:hypothetical protein